ncbi:MAG: SPOR domain-containing protein [Cryomorphaceae bacterium]|nr:MAG: SPOR domain-containing protein [Cryomorphaceae bacterium]
METTAETETLIKPRIEVGIGRLAFYGDVGASHRYSSPLLGPVGAHFRLGTPLNEYLDFDAFALYGRLIMNETAGPRHLNFSSRITMMGASLSYNFSHLLKPGSPVAPYVSVGIAGFEFLSKTDLHDSDGNRYHYWSDGTIRNLPESAPNANEAFEIQRNYIYETDIRKLDADGLGPYPERSWAIPVGAGVTLNLTDQVRLRVGTEMHFTFTNYIDGITEQSIGVRQGNSRNDRFMYTTAALSYDFAVKREKKKIREHYKGVDFLALELEDEDGDGVPDFKDECPGTPEGVKVDSRGCPIDSDGDGVPDYRDLEPDTPRGAFVDEHGVTISDETFAMRYYFWIDSLQEYNKLLSRVETESRAATQKTKRPQKSLYRVKADSDSELSNEMIERFLSIPDVITREVDEETVYLFGSYEELYKAVERKISLEADGINGLVVVDEDGNILSPDEDVASIEADLRRISKVDETFEEELAAPTLDVVYRVQIGAFANPLSKDVFTGVPELLVLKGQDGLTRYVSGSFTNIRNAADHKVELLLQGFEGAFITAYRGGKRISLNEAGAVVSGQDDSTREVASPAFDSKRILFKIQVGAYRDEVPTSVLDQFIDLGDIKPIRGPDGTTRYLYGSFSSYDAAQAARSKAVAIGFPDAFVVGEFSGQVISAQEAIRMLED